MKLVGKGVRSVASLKMAKSGVDDAGFGVVTSYLYLF